MRKADHIVGQGRCQLLKPREYVYVGEPIPELNKQQHAAFLMNFQKAILRSLERRNLLSHSQTERCLLELEKQRTHSNQHQA